MQSQFRLLATEVLKLTAEEREAFVQLLIASFDADSDVEESWAVEVERRISNIENGLTQSIPVQDALASVRAGLK
jgi:putative addiction module component (TIGR02574 family)